MTNDKDKTEVLSYIKELLSDLVEEYEELKLKCISSQESIDDLSNRLADMSKNIDSNYDYFSPGGKKVNLEKEKITLELKMLKLNMENYNNQCNILLRKIERINTINDYVVNSTSNSKEDSDGSYHNDSYGLQILETQESERTRIARDLHDSTVQNLTNLVHKSELCLKLSDIDIIRTKLELQSMIDTIRNTIDDMRAIIYDLRPMSIDDLGLVVTIERYVNRLKKEYEEVSFIFTVENTELIVKPVINITLFRIIQEACNNILEHAHAKEVLIQLCYHTNSIQVTISDNGVGFDNTYECKNEDNEICFGLSIMKERAYLLSGMISIESQLDKGTKIFVSVPL